MQQNSDYVYPVRHGKWIANFIGTRKRQTSDELEGLIRAKKSTLLVTTIEPGNLAGYRIPTLKIRPDEMDFEVLQPFQLML